MSGQLVLLTLNLKESFTQEIKLWTSFIIIVQVQQDCLTKTHYVTFELFSF